jgi:hypothetical protein
MANKTVFPAYFNPDSGITSGLQTTKIVTTANGIMYLYSLSMGVYMSSDGVVWNQFNTGITSAIGQDSEGSLAVDDNRVFTVTADGKVWYFDDDTIFADSCGG